MYDFLFVPSYVFKLLKRLKRRALLTYVHIMFFVTLLRRRERSKNVTRDIIEAPAMHAHVSLLITSAFLSFSQTRMILNTRRLTSSRLSRRRAQHVCMSHFLSHYHFFLSFFLTDANDPQYVTRDIVEVVTTPLADANRCLERFRYRRSTQLLSKL
jgi:hypothetical protein